ncbi:uncharacterized protein LOC116175695 [Photinus pyralis]|nr:uncharacterized protein LOC116175695 [Photinus pyralis]XP_031349797.1 uncharacterized protein LOC116175695 [Photinus pyralis]
MPNKPFTSHHSNVLKEVTYSSAPAKYGNETVIITRSTSRTLFEQTTTSIFKNFSYLGQPDYCNRNPFKYYTQCNAIPGLKTGLADGGISFSFNTFSHYSAQEHPNLFHYSGYPTKNLNQHCRWQDTQQSLTSDQQIALNQLRRNGLELMVIQEKMNQYPLQLRSSYDRSTSTVNLPSETSEVVPSRICEITPSGSTHQRSVSQNTSLPAENKIRKLVLTKSPDLQKQQTSSDADHGEEDHKETTKQ